VILDEKLIVNHLSLIDEGEETRVLMMANKSERKSKTYSKFLFLILMLMLIYFWMWGTDFTIQKLKFG